MSLKMEATKNEVFAIAKIASRAVEMANARGVRYKQIDCMMDIEACHCNGCKLDLNALANADDSNLAHDVFGIRRHIDRDTGKLGDCFIPRYAAR